MGSKGYMGGNGYKGWQDSPAFHVPISNRSRWDQSMERCQRSISRQ